MEVEVVNYYKSDNYIFQVITNIELKTFEIYSKHINSQNYSCITNLNYLISEFSNCLTTDDYIDSSTWQIKSEKKLLLLHKGAVDLFSNISFLNILVLL